MKIFIYFSHWFSFPGGHQGLLNIGSLYSKSGSRNGGDLLECAPPAVGDLGVNAAKVPALGGVGLVGKKRWFLFLCIKQLLYCWLVSSFFFFLREAVWWIFSLS